MGSEVQERTTGRQSRPRRFNLARHKSDADVYSRQQREPDLFRGAYSQYNLLVPPYKFSNLFLVSEQSDVLMTCIRAMADNIDGFGYSLKYLGEDRDLTEEKQEALSKSGLTTREKQDIVKQYALKFLRKAQVSDPLAKAERAKIESFFKCVNHDRESFRTIRKKFRKDYENTGNGCLEVVRNSKGEIESLYHIPIKYVRMTPFQDNATEVKVSILREGEEITTTRRMWFRKYAQRIAKKGEFTWFKEYGDPRVMNALTGKYLKDEVAKNYKVKCKSDKKYKSVFRARYKAQTGNDFVEASEILWIKQDWGGLAYGLPRWIGALFDVMGRHAASYVNYNLVMKGGVPQLIVTVNGGTLTEESYKDLMAALDEWQSDLETWTRAVVLESTPETMGLEDKGTAKIEVKFLTEGRQDDVMFEKYSKNSYDTPRKCFRIAPIYTGGTEDYNRAVAISAMKVTEQQSFQPEREDFDEIVNNKILQQGLGITLWEYKSNGPRIVGDEEFRLGFSAFAEQGAISLNDSIDLANASFGLEMSRYAEPWGQYPMKMILEMLKTDRLGGLEAIEKEVEETEPVETPNPEVPLVPGQKPNVIPFPQTKGDLDPSVFTPSEIAMYETILTVQEALDANGAPHEVTEHDREL